MPSDRDRDKVTPGARPQVRQASNGAWDVAENADPKAEGVPGAVRLLRHGCGRAEPGGGAATLGNAPELVCDRTCKGRDGRGGDCRRVRAPGNSAAARRGIERSLFYRADQLADSTGFGGRHARVAKRTRGNAETGT